MNRTAVQERYVLDARHVSSEAVVLAVGDVFSLKMRTDANGSGDRAAFADYADVTPELLRTLDPEVVVSSVLGRNFDCVDLAEKLSSYGFDGCFRLIGHGIPEPALVLNEMRSLFPDLRVEIDAGT